MNLDIVKISEKCYKLYKLINNKRDTIILNLENIKSPFGLEKYKNVYYINWEIDIDIMKILNKIEDEIKIKINNNDIINYQFISNIKEKKNFIPLLKTRIRQIKNKFIINSNESLFDIKYNSELNISIEIDSIWINQKLNTWGLLWITSDINSI